MPRYEYTPQEKENVLNMIRQKKEGVSFQGLRDFAVTSKSVLNNTKLGIILSDLRTQGFITTEADRVGREKVDIRFLATDKYTTTVDERIQREFLNDIKDPTKWYEDGEAKFTKRLPPDFISVFLAQLTLQRHHFRVEGDYETRVQGRRRLKELKDVIVEISVLNSRDSEKGYFDRLDVKASFLRAEGHAPRIEETGQTPYVDTITLALQGLSRRTQVIRSGAYNIAYASGGRRDRAQQMYNSVGTFYKNPIPSEFSGPLQLLVKYFTQTTPPDELVRAEIKQRPTHTWQKFQECLTFLDYQIDEALSLGIGYISPA